MSSVDELAPLAHEAVAARVQRDATAWAAVELALRDLTREQLASLVAVLADLGGTFTEALAADLGEQPADLAAFWRSADPRVQEVGDG